MRTVVGLVLPFVLWADVGGLQRLPEAAIGPDIADNGGFERGATAPENWNLGNGWSWIKNDAAHCRGGAGPNCLARTGAASSSARIRISVNHRTVRARMWVRTEGGDPGSNARVYVYAFDATHGPTAFACGAAANQMSLAGGLANWTQYTLCEDVALSSLHFDDNLDFNIFVTNLAANVTLYLDDFTVEPVLQPLVIFPIYPNYRGMLWPDQGEILKWNSIVEPPSPYSAADLRVDVDLLRAGDGAPITTLSNSSLAPVETAGGQVGYSVNAMTYDARGLPDGAYYLRGKLLRKADNTVLYTYPDYKIVREQPSVQRDRWKIWIDKYNRTVFRGKPQFVYGAYFSADSWTTQFVPGAVDCCSPTTADAHRKIALGCVRRQFTVQQITNGSPAVITVPSHNLKDGAQITLSGGTASWAAANGCYYWIGCPHGNAQNQIKRIDANTFSAPVDTTSLGPFTGQNITMVRGACYEDDRPLTTGDTTFGSNGSSLINVMGRTRMNTIIRYGNFASANGGITPPNCTTYNSRDDNLTPWLTAIQDVDAWHLQIVNHYYPGTVPMAPGWWGATCTASLQTPEEKVRWMINRVVSQKPIGNTDGFMGLYVADEPLNQNPSQGLAATFAKVNEWNSLGFGGISYWASTAAAQPVRQWNNIVDAHGMDPYPVGVGMLSDDVAIGVGTGQAKRHGRSYFWPRLMSDALFDSRPNWTVIQLFQVGSSFPTLADQKIQIVSALAAGSHGILWWQLAGASGLSHRTPAEYQNFERSSKVIGDVMSMLSEPVQDLSGRQDGQAEFGRLIGSISDPDIKCSSRRQGASTLLACANTTNTAKSVTIQMAQPIRGEILLPWDGRKLAPNPSSGQNSFTLEFKGLLDPVVPEDSVQLLLMQSITLRDAAALRSGPVAPGQIVSIFGSELGPSSSVINKADPNTGVFGSLLAGTRVLFDQLPAPLLFVSPGQINGAVPYGVAGKPGTRIAVEQAGKETVALTLPVADAAPGIFTADSSGSGQAAAWNRNGAWNSAANPAGRGSVVVLYATGAGLTDPPSIDGRLADPPLPQPLLLVSIRIGGRDASVLYAGASAGLLAGILQVNAVVPEDAPTGDAVPVTLIVGGAESQPGVTLAVR